MSDSQAITGTETTPQTDGVSRPVDADVRRTMTMAEAEAAYDAAPAVPLSKERIDEIVQYAIRERCFYDTDADGDCHRCDRRGGCKAIGGPFIRCIACCEVKPNAEIMIRQPYCRTCY